ncbi:MAG: hypothetical protein OHK0046_46020 [Anaerolineae bacterium]
MYTTLSRLLIELRQDTPGQPAEEADEFNLASLLDALDTAVTLIDGATHQWFAPLIRTTYHTAARWKDGGEMNQQGRLWLRYPLLTLTSISIEGQTLDSERFVLLPRGDRHFDSVLFLHPQDVWQARTAEDAIAISGVWTYRSDRNLGWIASGDTVQANITAAQAQITVADVDGLDSLLAAPRFSPGVLIRMGEELAQVRSVDSLTNTLHVTRGIRGSTAAAHMAGTQIDLWEPEPDISRAAARWATMIYRRRAAFETTTIEGLGQITTWPKHMPSDVAAILPRYTNLSSIRVATSGGQW